MWDDHSNRLDETDIQFNLFDRKEVILGQTKINPVTGTLFRTL